MKLPSLKVICLTNKDTAPQSHEILQTFVRCCDPPPPPPQQYKHLWIFAALLSHIFALLRRITFKFGSFTNIKVPLSVASTVFPQLIHDKSWRSIVLLWIVSVYPETIRTYIPKRGRGGGGTAHKFLLFGGVTEPLPPPPAPLPMLKWNLTWLFYSVRSA